MVEDINGAFLPLGQLKTLGLAHNQIKSVNKNAFTGLSRLDELDLTENNITSIQDSAFFVMPFLRVLHMNTSKFCSLFFRFLLNHCLKAFNLCIQ